MIPIILNNEPAARVASKWSTLDRAVAASDKPPTSFQRLADSLRPPRVAALASTFVRVAGLEAYITGQRKAPYVDPKAITDRMYWMMQTIGISGANADAKLARLGLEVAAHCTQRDLLRAKIDYYHYLRMAGDHPWKAHMARVIAEDIGHTGDDDHQVVMDAQTIIELEAVLPPDLLCLWRIIDKSAGFGIGKSW